MKPRQLDTDLRTWWSVLLLVLAVAACKGDGINTSSSTGTLTSSAVTSTSPANGSTGVGTNATITAGFSQPMTAASIANSSFFVAVGSIRVIGNVSFDAANNIATFTPGAALAANTAYTATLSTGVMDASGNALAANFVWTFTTGPGPDTVPPQVSATAPASGATGIAVNMTIAATFSKVMAASGFTATSFQVTAPGPVPVAGSASFNGYTAVFTPAANLPANTTLTATIAGTVHDLAGNTVSNGVYTWIFTTASATDLTAPTVSSTGIANGATGVPVNLKVAAFFSRPMDPATITTGSFTLSQGTTPVAGTVTYLAGAATFNPSVALAANTQYTATISTAAKDLSGNAMASAFVWGWTTGAGPQTALPTVSLTIPANGAVNTALNDQFAVTFSEAMDPATVTTANFTLQIPGISPVAGTVSDVGATATFTPTGNLLPNTQYTATISTGVTNLAGAAPASSYVWTFSTSAIADTTSPTVSASIPGNQAAGVPLNSRIAVAFSEAIGAATATNASFTIAGPGGAVVPGQIRVSNNVATFTPNANLLPDTAYTATVAPGIENLAGNSLAANYSFGFTTGTAADSSAPAVSATLPVAAATGVFINQAVDISFSEAMDPATISTSTISLKAPGSMPVAGTVIYYPASFIASFVPLGNLQTGTSYTAAVGTDVKDLQGNAIAAGSTWSFTTGTAIIGLAPVNLGSLASFAVVAGAGLRNSNSGGQTAINGNVGLSPGATCLGDGAPCSATDPLINGTLYANDAAGVASSAKTDLAAAYADAFGRSAGAAANDLSAKTLAPGVYTSLSAIGVAAGGTVTLDARGNPNAVWIFQVGTTLTMNDNAQVTLINGARSANVFWAVAGAVSIGAGVSFQGNVLIQGSGTVGAGSTISGRLLCANGGVTLQSDNITVPGP